MEHDPGSANIFYSLKMGIYQRQFSEMIVVFLIMNSLFVLPQFTVMYTTAIASCFLR